MIPQLTIFLTPEGTVRAEAPGAPRRPIDLPLDFAQRNPELVAELTAQQAVARQRAAAALRHQQAINVQYVAERHGTDLARRIWRDGELAFSQALKRKFKPERSVVDELREAEELLREAGL